MGTLYELTCDTCDYTRSISDGCGMGGCRTNFYCPHCGTLKDHWHSVGEMEAREPEPPAPRCGVHPVEPMPELTFPEEQYGFTEPVRTKIPCRRRCDGMMVAQGVGIWD